MSFSKNLRRSGTPYLSWAIRSMPIPKAKPWTRSGSYPFSATKPKTLGSTIPEPRISIQPTPLQSGSREPSGSFPLPPQRKQETSTSTLGSVKGKNPGRKRVSRSGPKIPRASSSSVPFRSASVMSSPTASPSTWWKIGLWVASKGSER
jgi:hypothetical protein